MCLLIMKLLGLGDPELIRLDEEIQQYKLGIKV